MAQTPEHCKALINYHMDTIDVCTHEIMRLDAEPVSAARLSDKSYWTGVANGVSAMLDTELRRCDCFVGFMHIGLPRTNDQGLPYSESVSPYHPEFTEWRRHYFTTGEITTGETK